MLGLDWYYSTNNYTGTITKGSTFMFMELIYTHLLATPLYYLLAHQ